MVDLDATLNQQRLHVPVREAVAQMTRDATTITSAENLDGRTPTSAAATNVSRSMTSLRNSV
jgi:hypothetical protein